MIAARLLATTLLVAALGSESTLAASGDGYRVAGIMAVGSDYLAFLALPDGQQRLVRAGSVVDGARVASLSDHSLRLVFPDHEMTLTLDAGVRSAPTPHAAAPSSSQVASAATKPAPRAGSVLPVGAAAVDPALKHPRAVSSQQVRSLVATVPAGDAGRAVAVSLAGLADLPPGSRVTQVDDMPVTGAAAALEQIAARIGNGYPASLNVTTTAGPVRIYLMAAVH
jgi:hypothetical protein